MKKYKYLKKAVQKNSVPDEVLKLSRINYDYDSDTGLIRNLKTNKVYSNVDKKGYLLRISIRYNNIEWLWVATRLIWYLVNNELLDSFYQIDHINGVKNDNRMSNLRKVTQSENQMNTKSRLNSSSKYKGVSFDKSCNKWKCKISIGNGSRLNKSEVYIGKFENEYLAAWYYDSAAKYYHREFAKLNFPNKQTTPMNINSLKNKLKNDSRNRRDFRS